MGIGFCCFLCVLCVVVEDDLLFVWFWFMLYVDNENGLWFYGEIRVFMFRRSMLIMVIVVMWCKKMF